jgi:LPPG:FO 2-phospho-L-lactate transferase
VSERPLVAPVLALAGGVGGAKLAAGLSRVLAPDELTIAVNTGDDETFHGLHVSPDLDTVMYVLAGLQNRGTGWGIAGDSFEALAALERLGAESWFRLGDRDLATHIRRTEWLRSGWTLSAVTAELCRHLGVKHRLAPMCDQAVRTIAITDEGELAFQDYFVRRRCEPRLIGTRFTGIEDAVPADAFASALAAARTIVFCPSNPFVSIAPILAIPGVRAAVESSQGLRIAVSPIIGGEAVKGPAAKMCAELGEQPSALSVARRYRGLCDLFVLDEADRALTAAVAALGMKALVTDTIMTDATAETALAETILEAARTWR